MPAHVPAASSAPRRVAVVGIGNVLTGDDALGPTVVRTLEAAWELPPGVEVLDAGTPGMDLVALVGDAADLIVVDTVLSDGGPGTLRLYDRQMLVGRPLTPRVNPHAPGLAETLLTLELSGGGPERVRLVGVVPGATEVGVGLSPAVAAAVPRAVRAVVDTLLEWGTSPTSRRVGVEPDLWWRSAARGAFLTGSGAR